MVTVVMYCENDASNGKSSVLQSAGSRCDYYPMMSEMGSIKPAFNLSTFAVCNWLKRPDVLLHTGDGTWKFVGPDPLVPHCAHMGVSAGMCSVNDKHRQPLSAKRRAMCIVVACGAARQRRDILTGMPIPISSALQETCRTDGNLKDRSQLL
jgi:hypothetical protein